MHTYLAIDNESLFFYIFYFEIILDFQKNSCKNSRFSQMVTSYLP